MGPVMVKSKLNFAGSSPLYKVATIAAEAVAASHIGPAP